MPVLQLDDQQFPLRSGTTRIGAGTDADVVVPGYSGIPVEAIIDAGPMPTIRRADDASHVRVNGVLLGAEPSPLMHGDKIEVAGLELRYADDAKGGATQFVSANDLAAAAGTRRAGVARATAASGGRLVSLVDGKEYAVADSGLVFGRDASCDVVVPQNEVSRRHAEIMIGDDGYVLRDTSANGLYVNGERVQESRKLARADILRIGSEEFRFYADVLAAAASPAARPAAPAAVAETAAPTTPMTVPIDVDLFEMDLVPTMPTPPASAPPAPMHPVSAAPTPAASAPAAAPPGALKDPRAVTAVLESLNEGPGKGTRYELRSALGHVGRGAHNDVRLSDESVSETHAKLQRREDGWYLVDMGSTNGTYAGGSRVVGEKKLEGSPDVRFGGMKFRFTALGGQDVSETKGTRAIAAVRTTAPVPEAVPDVATAAPAPVSTRGGMPGWLWVVVGVLVVAAAAFFLLKARP
ncbi:MAG: FHA domain-containing protein [bacterium]